MVQSPVGALVSLSAGRLLLPARLLLLVRPVFLD